MVGIKVSNIIPLLEFLKQYYFNYIIIPNNKVPDNIDYVITDSNESLDVKPDCKVLVSGKDFKSYEELIQFNLNICPANDGIDDIDLSMLDYAYSNNKVFNTQDDYYSFLDTIGTDVTPQANCTEDIPVSEFNLNDYNRFIISCESIEYQNLIKVLLILPSLSESFINEDSITVATLKEQEQRQREQQEQKQREQEEQEQRQQEQREQQEQKQQEQKQRELEERNVREESEQEQKEEKEQKENEEKLEREQKEQKEQQQEERETLKQQDEVKLNDDIFFKTAILSQIKENKQSRVNEAKRKLYEMSNHKSISQLSNEDKIALLNNQFWLSDDRELYNILMSDLVSSSDCMMNSLSSNIDTSFKFRMLSSYNSMFKLIERNLVKYNIKFSSSSNNSSIRQHFHNSKIIGVASASNRLNTSNFCLNLVDHYSKLGSRVLLIDLNVTEALLSKSILSTMYTVQESSEVITKKSFLTAFTKGIVLNDYIKNLDYYSSPASFSYVTDDNISTLIKCSFIPCNRLDSETVNTVSFYNTYDFQNYLLYLARGYDNIVVDLGCVNDLPQFKERLLSSSLNNLILTDGYNLTSIKETSLSVNNLSGYWRYCVTCLPEERRNMTADTISSTFHRPCVGLLCNRLDTLSNNDVQLELYSNRSNIKLKNQWESIIKNL